MSIIDQIPAYDETKLTAIEENAKQLIAKGADKRKAEAESVLLAIEVERRRRKAEADQRRKHLGAEIAERVKDMGLFDRVVYAFSEMPPEAWEVEVLKEIAAGPGRDFDTLARAIGKRGGRYINLAVGSLCSAREPYLGPAPPAQKVKHTKVYSALMIDFTRHVEPTGREWHGWTLKPEAEAALRHIGIVG